MWLRTLDNTIINLTHVHVLEIREQGVKEGEPDYELVAAFPNGMRTVVFRPNAVSAVARKLQCEDASVLIARIDTPGCIYAVMLDECNQPELSKL